MTTIAAPAPSAAIRLRDYQREAIEEIRTGYRNGLRRVAVQLPTGTGKTIVFGNIAAAASHRNSRVLILAHRDELIAQAIDKLTQVDAALHMLIGRVQGRHDDVDRQIVVASVQTVARQRRLDRLTASGRFDIIIVDEAHHVAADTYQRVLAGLGCFEANGPLLIGVSATLLREDKRSLGDTFEAVVYQRDILSMIRRGYLCDLRGIRVKLQDFDADKLRTVGGDYVADQAGEMLHDAKAPEHAVAAWLQKAAGRKTLVFTPTIALAQEMAREFADRGVTAESVSGVTMQERRAILDRFHRGETMVVTNAQVLTEGYDEPTIECVMIARPTKSVILYAQMVGRGTRRAPGKKDCLIIDVAGATDKNDLTVLPRLFGLGDEPEAQDIDLGDLDDLEALIEELGVAGAAEARIKELARRGRIIAKQVELFKRQETNWVAINGGWTLQGGGMTLTMESEDGDSWDVIAYRRNALPEMLLRGVEQGYAMGAAEDYLREHDAYNEHLVSKSAKWRGGTPSPDQIKTAKRLGVKVRTGMTKGEVSDLITAAIAESRRRQAAR